jgi:hypothetical protein
MSYICCTRGSTVLSYSTTTATSCCADVTLVPHVLEFCKIQIKKAFTAGSVWEPLSEEVRFY